MDNSRAQQTQISPLLRSIGKNMFRLAMCCFLVFCFKVYFPTKPLELVLWLNSDCRRIFSPSVVQFKAVFCFEIMEMSVLIFMS